MKSQDLRQIKGLLEDSFKTQEERFDLKLKEQENRAEKKFATKKGLEKLNTKVTELSRDFKDFDEDFKSSRRSNDRKFDQIITLLKELRAGAFSFDSRLNNHEVRINNLESVSAKV